MNLEKVHLGPIEIETNCPHYSVHVSPADFRTGDPLQFVCEEKENGTNNCQECLLANITAILMHIRDVNFTILRELQQGNKGGGFVIPTIQTRK